MKRNIKYLTISVAVVISVLVAVSARTMLTRFPETKIWKESNIQRPKDFDGYVNKLAGGLQIPTISNDDTLQIDFSQFAKFRNYVQEQYPNVFKNVEYNVINNNAMLLKWRGSNPKLNPILFNSHYDVVPAGDTSLWQHKPFGAEIQNGRIYGRGSIDMKGMLFALMSSADILIKQGFKPQRDIYFAFGYDEETKQTASKKIAQYLKSKNITFDAIYDEGGMINKMNINEKDYGFAMIGITEKGYLTLRINVFADGGHSSMPGQKTAMGAAATIINRLEKNQMPASISNHTKESLMSIGGVSGFSKKLAMANMDILKPVIIKTLSQDPTINALIRTTTAVTQIQGSQAENVIPNIVPITVNFRLLPGDKINDVIEHVKKQCKDFDTKIEIIEGREATIVSSTKNRGFVKISESLKSVYPTANILPYTCVATTDSRNYIGDLGDNVYRLLPAVMTSSEIKLYHSPDENITLDNYANMISYFKLLMQNYDAPQNIK